LIALAFAPEHPACLSSRSLSFAIPEAVNRPPDSFAILEMMVSDALTESCWDRIDSAKDEKFVDGDLIRPIVDGPATPTTFAKRESCSWMNRAIDLAFAIEITPEFLAAVILDLSSWPAIVGRKQAKIGGGVQHPYSLFLALAEFFSAQTSISSSVDVNVCREEARWP
jgi:hypothetical protein